MATYKVLVGIEYGDKRVEAGEVVSDVPTKSVSWLLEQNIIELADESTAKTGKKSFQTETVIEEEAK